MGEEAYNNYKLSLEMLKNGDISRKDEFARREEEINDTNRHVTSFLVKLSLEELGEIDEKKVTSFNHVVSDVERIGDYAENIVEYAEQMIDAKARFSEAAMSEIMEMDAHLSELYKYVVKTFAENTLAYVGDVEREEQATDDICTKMQQMHLARMTSGECTVEAGAVYLQLALNLERIGDHMHNIANSVKQYARAS